VAPPQPQSPAWAATAKQNAIITPETETMNVVFRMSDLESIILVGWVERSADPPD
jgi:hypothetical protein